MGIALDYTARIAPSALFDAGVSDVLRYLCYSPVGDWKVIHKSELDELRSHGFRVTLNWEFDAKDWAHDEGTGTAHGTEAVRQAHALGYPAGCTIIGSADFDMSRSTWDSLGQHYCRGFANAVRAGGYRPGVYGPYDVLTWVRDSGQMDVFWQAGMSTAWSGGRNKNLWAGAHIRQLHHQNVGGQDTDVSEILIDSWGQAGGIDMTSVWDEQIGANYSPGGHDYGDHLFRTAIGYMWPRLDEVKGLVIEGFAADDTRDKANTAAIQALADVIKTGGGNVDSAAIIQHIDSVVADGSQAVKALTAEITRLNRIIAAGAQAAATS